ncbi:tyrosine-type recombinase/integrase [Neorhizobium alkalisoli]|uniref:Phage integrase family protein n=1 Tax=Neorhizobium alkalisoli TaxID=528178 RepID=A0A561QSC0_9HYPH|nr:tyrosine-type recombinase/integrase [Neorhizobium alkalisoli]TWF53229.1 phage integrase family protein [Neorhizobium alkalisoli]
MPLKLTRRKGSDNWYIRGTIRGESVFESTGTCDRAVAEEIRIQAEARILTESVHGKKTLVTFEEAASSYLASGGSPRFLISYSKTSGKASGVAVHFKGKLLKDIGQADLDAAARILYPHASPETRNRQCYTPFIAVWSHAAGNQWAEKREWRRPRKPKGTNIAVLKRKRAGTRATEYDRAAQFVAEMTPASAQIMTALFYTGMRPIELFVLQAADVNVAGRWITIQKSKIGEGRGVPMHEFLVPLFEALTVRGGILFRSHKGEPYPPSDEFGGQIDSAVKGARARLKKRGVEMGDISPYTARHTVSTQLVINGVHPYIKDQILGHAVDDMSRHYTHVPQAPLIEAINTLPVPASWRSLEWWQDPVYFSRKLRKWGAKKEMQRSA